MLAAVVGRTLAALKNLSLRRWTLVALLAAFKALARLALCFLTRIAAS